MRVAVSVLLGFLAVSTLAGLAAVALARARARARAALQAAQSIEGLLGEQRQRLFDVAHEIRSPLTRLAITLDALAHASERHEAIARAKRDVARMGELVESLLHEARVSGHGAIGTPTDLILEFLVDRIVDDCRIEAEARRCSLVLRAAGASTIRADQELVRRAVENVIRNAVTHSPAGTSVEIEVATRGDQAIVTVRDFGPGVPDEAVPHLFEPFFRVKEASAGSGVGLGLSIADRAAGRTSGQVRAENAHPGLRVELTWPVHT